MCINRIYYGEEAISRIERNEEGKRNWLSKKEKKKVKKECKNHFVWNIHGCDFHSDNHWLIGNEWF